MRYILIEAASSGGIFMPVFSDRYETLHEIMRKRITEIRDAPELSIITETWGWAEKDGESHNFRIFEIPEETFFV